MHSPFTIEFVGAPASGKTTISKAVATALRTNGYPVFEPTRNIGEKSSIQRISKKALFAGIHSLSNPKTTISDSHSILQTDQQATTDAIKMIFNWLYLSGLYSRHKGGIRIVDQGLFQALWSIGYRSNLDWAEALRCVDIPSALCPDIVVAVTANKESLYARLGDRHQSKTRVSKHDNSEIDAAITGISHLLESLTELENIHPDFDIIGINNSGKQDIETISQTVVSQVEDRLQEINL